MSEVAGKIATQAGAFMLEKPMGGRGLLLGGVPGVAAGKVMVIGGGVVGQNAAEISVGLGGETYVYDRSIDRLRELEVLLNGRVSTCFASTLEIESRLPEMDLVIGAVLVHGATAPRVITREQLKLMKRNAVLVDVSIDQGGCFETSRPTTHSDPTYEVDGITHYCVANMPGRGAHHLDVGADQRDDALPAQARRRGRAPRPRRRPGLHEGPQRRRRQADLRARRARPGPRVHPAAGRARGGAHRLAAMFLKERLAREGDVLNGVLERDPLGGGGTGDRRGRAPTSSSSIASTGRSAASRMQAMIAATAGTACAPLVRVPGVDAAEVKVALDAGAEGIFFPMVRSAADVERCVASVTYPPAGTRGWGPFVAHARHATTPAEYSNAVGPHITCCVQIETLEAVRDIEAIVRVPGVDLVMIAPFDLSSALGIEGQFDATPFVEAVAGVERAVAAAGVALCGVALTAERAAALAAGGYRALLRGIDVFMLADAVAALRDG